MKKAAWLRCRPSKHLEQKVLPAGSALIGAEPAVVQAHGAVPVVEHSRKGPSIWTKNFRDKFFFGRILYSIKLLLYKRSFMR